MYSCVSLSQCSKFTIYIYICVCGYVCGYVRKIQFRLFNMIYENSWTFYYLELFCPEIPTS